MHFLQSGFIKPLKVSGSPEPGLTNEHHYNIPGIKNLHPPTILDEFISYNAGGILSFLT